MTLKQLVTFDIMRILRWDIGRALNRPIHPIIWKALAGWFGGPLLVALVAAGSNWRPSGMMELLAAAVGAAVAVVPDLRRILQRRSFHAAKP